MRYTHTRGKSKQDGKTKRELIGALVGLPAVWRMSRWNERSEEQKKAATENRYPLALPEHEYFNHYQQQQWPVNIKYKQREENFYSYAVVGMCACVWVCMWDVVIYLVWTFKNVVNG